MSNTLFTCSAPLPRESYTDLDDSFAEVEAKVLEVGRKVQRGGAGEFEITPQHLEEMVRNHERDAELGYEPPAVVGHPERRDQAPAVGWVTKLRAAADGLYARVKFLGDFAKRVKAGEFRYSSPSFSFNWHDEEGSERGAKLLDLGILNNPFQKGLGAFALAEINTEAAGAEDIQPPLFEVGDDPEVSKMADASLELGELRLKTTQQESEIKTLTDERDGLEAKLSEAQGEIADLTTKTTEQEAEIAELSEQVKATERERTAAKITTLLSEGLNAGKLTSAQVKGYGTDEFDAAAWLSESPFKDSDALGSFLKTAPRVVDLSERTALTSGDAPDADRRNRIERFAEAAMAANPSLSKEKALELAGANA